MDCELGWWEAEDKPATAGVDARETERVLDELPIGFGIFAIENRVTAADQPHHKGAPFGENLGSGVAMTPNGHEMSRPASSRVFLDEPRPQLAR
jgi:hypothetical protein